jgi:hypothetical protein
LPGTRAAVAGRHEQAARIVGVAEGLRKRTGVVSRRGRAVIERDEAAIRDLLEAEAFAVAVTAGAAVPLDEALGEVEALNGTLASGESAATVPRDGAAPRSHPGGLSDRELKSYGSSLKG